MAQFALQPDEEPATNWLDDESLEQDVNEPLGGGLSPEERREINKELPVQENENHILRPSEDGDADADLDEPELHHHDTR